MAKTIQIRNVPEKVRRILKSRAEAAGMSLSDYLLMELREIAERPTLSELQQRISGRTPVTLPASAAVLVRAERDAR